MDNPTYSQIRMGNTIIFLRIVSVLCTLIIDVDHHAAIF
jgi:hypothetical protein